MDNTPLEVKEVRLFPKEDGAKHYTNKFQTRRGTCILRRGQVFHLAISFASQFDPRFHRVLLEFHSGADVKRLETSSGLLRMLDSEDENPWPPGLGDWSAKTAYNKHEMAVAVMVVSPTWLPVGRWFLEVRTELIDAPDLHSPTFIYPGNIYFLFNPWNSEDDTYFEDSSLLQEYVLKDIGHVWGPSHSLITVWEYAQFEESVLLAFELALEQDGMLRRHRRGNPIEVARAISRIVNANGTGILVGRWAGDEPGAYAGGKPPNYWTGSAEILQQYLDSGGQPVKYAQCWVFAGVAATICRALGLPTRLVTNLESAHDNDESLTLDLYYNQDLEEAADVEGIWNFHCWVDVWMRRPDLRKLEYDGWQAVDGTPQIVSRGQYQCGPAPLNAVLIGDTQVSFDVPFVFVEVNGDRARWLRKPNGRLRLIDVHENLIGQAVLTDDPYSPNKPRVSNITDQYKHPEGSIPERMSVWRATSNPHLAHAARRRRELDDHRFLNDVEFEAHSPYTIEFGEDFDIALSITNASGQERTVTSELILDVVDHRGNSVDFIKTSGRLRLPLRPNESETRHMFVTAQEYASRLRENSFLRYRAKSFVRETDQPWLSHQPAIAVTTPNLEIQINDELWVGRPVWAYFKFDRIINYTLTDCQLRLGGSGLERDGAPVYLDDVPSGERLYLRIRIQPVRAGLQKITAKFTSVEIPKVESWIQVDVRDTGADYNDVLNFDEHMEEIMDNAFEDNFIRP